MVSEHGRGFWAVLDPPADGVDSRVGFLPEGPGLAALESPELAELLTELLTRHDELTIGDVEDTKMTARIRHGDGDRRLLAYADLAPFVEAQFD